MPKCCFCQEECDGKIVLRDVMLSNKDGSDMIVCNICLNLYADRDYDKLTKRLKARE